MRSISLKIITNVLLLLSITLNAQKIAGGGAHSLSICNDSTVKAWGSNFFGQLGDSTKVDKITPIEVRGLKKIIAVSAGNKNSIALRNDGTVWTWGDGVLLPQRLDSINQVSKISCGTDHSIALKSDGTLWAWGDNGNGQLGDSTKTTRSIPVKVYGLSNVISIAGGNKYSLALKSDGTVWAWGDNSFGQLGDSSLSSSLIPKMVFNISYAKEISAGFGKLSFAIMNDGTVWAWGANFYGQLGDSTKTTIGCMCKTIPVKVHNLSNVIAIESINENAIALKNDGTVWAWGLNIYGQLGDGTNADKMIPTNISSLSNIGTIAGGGNHSLAFKSDGTLNTWGYNISGQLGDGTVSSNTCKCKNSPVLVNNLCSNGSGIRSIDKDNSIIVYPNPSNGKFSIDFKEKQGIFYNEVYNSIGQIILRQNSLKEIDLSNFHKGIYIIHISIGADNYYRQIIIE